MKILITGSTGMVGSELVFHLQKKGHQVSRLVRRKENVGEPQIGWEPAAGILHAPDIERFDAIIHLAGESIASGRWTEERKKRILDSRVKGTRLLAEAIQKLKHPPKTFICASAMGYYGSRGDEILTEVSGWGQGFLAEVCREWEAEAHKASRPETRVVNTRFGMILSPQGGALKAMLPAFRLGVAGRLGSGRQYMSWIALPDVVSALEFILHQEYLSGPVNVTSPQPVTNAEFTHVLREVATCPLSPGKIWAPPVPGWVLKLVLGQMGEELLLASQRMQPVRLVEAGFNFQYPDLKSALQAVL